ncbi:MAG: hypothetical protein QXL67_01450 [Candidatus Bathyarchaeia archaeon]
MTHTLHRQGSVESLKSDYVVLVMSCRGYNDKGATSKLVKALEILSSFNPVNMGDMKTGSVYTRGFTYKTIVEKATDTSIFHAVFTDVETVAKALEALKKADLGMSVVVSGLYGEVSKAVEKVGLKPHTVNVSLGIWGRIDLLPKDPEVMEIITMCGHAMVSKNLVYKLASDVKRGKTVPEEAARSMAKCCTCGVFNLKRAADIIERLSRKV